MKGCVLCGGTGWFSVEGRSRFDGSIVSGARECLCKKQGAPIVHEDSCSRCQGYGVFGGELSGQYAGPWKWCTCAAGVERQQREPGIIAESNIAREKLIRKFGPKPLRAMVEGLSMSDPYHGEF